MRLRGSRAVLRAVTSLLAGVVLVGVTSPIGAQSAAEGSPPLPVRISRYAGVDRYETALRIAGQVVADAGGTTEWAVIASGTSWTDAVVASSLSGALEAPLILTPPDELRTDVVSFLKETQVANVLVVGASATPGVSADVVSELAARGYLTERISGDDRYSTGVRVARHLGKILQGSDGLAPQVGDMGGLGRTAIVASGEVFVDALVSGPVAARGRHPVLLTPASRLHREVAAYLDDADVEHVVLMGGTEALGAPVEAALRELGLAVTRLAGATRFETAVAMADLVTDRYTDVTSRTCFERDRLGVARDRVPFDSFSAAPLLAGRCAPLLLSHPKQTNGATAGFLETIRSSGITSPSHPVQLYVFGGEAAVSYEVLNAYLRGQVLGTAEEPVARTLGCDDSGRDRVRVSIDGVMRQIAWTSDCGRLLAVTETGALYVADGNGSNPVQVLKAARRVEQAAWSPDGKQIAFASNKRSRYGLVRHIHVINADGSGGRQVTDGPANDNHPSWSADGRQLVFQRRDGAARDGSETAREQDTHIVVIGADGRNATALRTGGTTEFFPAFSPDGRRIAFTAADAVWTIDVDGSDLALVTTAVETCGVSWSPDGSRVIALRRSAPGHPFAVYVVAAVDGYGEGYVQIPGNLNTFRISHSELPPQWSPDGRRVFLHFADRGPSHDAAPRSVNWQHFFDVPDIPDRGPGTCRTAGPASTRSAGFPRPSTHLPTSGTMRIAVLFVDFPDRPISYDTELEMSSARFIEEYLESMSGGTLEVELEPHHGWLRAEQHHRSYLEHRRLYQQISQHAVELADADVDFSDIDLVMTVMPSTRFGAGSNHGDFVTADGNEMYTMRVNHDPGFGGGRVDSATGQVLPQENQWAVRAARELLRSYGLSYHFWGHLYGGRYYPPGHLFARPPLPEGLGWASIDIGPLILNARYPISANFSLDDRYEMLSWTRWLLGWLDADQIECVTGPSAEVRLSPIADAGTGIAMAVVETSPTGVIVIESRRLLGHDARPDWMFDRVADGTADELLIREGVLVYTVHPFITSHPVRIAQDTEFGYLDQAPLLELGESVSVAGYTITVTGDTGSAHTVSIRQND